MRRMAEDFFAASPVLSLPILAMLVFAGVFIAVVIRALRADANELAADASLPLENDHHD